MKLIRIFSVCIIVLFVVACGSDDKFTFPDSKSYNKNQITLDESIAQKVVSDTAFLFQDSTFMNENLGNLFELLRNVKHAKSDSTWNLLQDGWLNLKMNSENQSDSLKTESANLADWAELNTELLKLSGDAKFADELENLLYKSSSPVLGENLLKSLIYTHIEDKIFINLFASSSLTHNHTTGGILKLIQETKYPASDEIILKCESSDTRFLHVFIRIPEWAVNPTVTHGNVKYVARPGEYSEIMRKWKDGDEFLIKLKN
jgi:hypothetical protein